MLCLLLAAHSAVPFVDACQRMSFVTSARAALTDAEAALRNAEKNPAAPPRTVALARQQWQLAKLNMYYAVLNAKTEQMTLYAAVLQARNQIAIDEVNTSQNELGVQVAAIRRQSGSITVQELMKATDSLTRAGIDAANTKCQLAMALTNLHTISEEPLTFLSPPPVVILDQLHIQGLPALLEANTGVSNAECAVTLAHGSDTAAVDLQARERELSQARENVKAVEMQLTLALDTAKQQYQSALTVHTDSEHNLTSAQKALVMLKTQFQNGLASKMSYLEGQAIVNNAMLARDTALMSLWHAYYALLLAAGAPAN